MSDDLTIEMVGALAEDLYQTHYDLDEEDESVRIAISPKGFNTIIYMRLDDDDIYAHERNLQISFCFEVTSMPMMDLNKIDIRDVSIFCLKLQEYLTWSTARLMSYPEDKNRINVLLYRITSITELELTQDYKKQFKKVLEFITDEWIQIAPALYLIATGQAEIDDDMQELLQEMYTA